MDAEARSFRFSANTASNINRARDALDRWKATGSLSPLAARMELDLAAAPESLGPGYLRRVKADADRFGQVLLDVTDESGFVLWTFELALRDGPGFPYLDPNYKPALLSVTPDQPEFTTVDPKIPQAPALLPTFEFVCLGERSLAAIWALLFPTSKLRSETSDYFRTLQKKFKELVLHSGTQAVQWAATEDDKRRDFGVERQARWEQRHEVSVAGLPQEALAYTDHPAAHLSHERRREWRQLARERTTKGGEGLPVWLPWPTGYRGIHSHALSKREVLGFFELK